MAPNSPGWETKSGGFRENSTCPPGTPQPAPVDSANRYPVPRFPVSCPQISPDFQISEGKDARGIYTEFVFEENLGQAAIFSGDGSDYPNCSQRTDKDGVFRIYDNQDGSITLVLVNLTVLRNPPDQLLVGGKVRWACTRSKLNVPDRIVLPNAGFTSYGINSLVARRVVDPETAILVDYNKQFVDLSNPDSAAVNLVRSARHLGRLNVLFADHSVRTMGPSQLDPRFNMDIWSP